MRTVHEPNTEPNPNKWARITSFTIPVSVGKQFRNLPALDRQVIVACCSKHILSFDIVEDPVFSWANPCAVSRRQSISDRVSELDRYWRLKITEKIRGKFLTIVLDGWTNTVSNNHHICFALWSGEKNILLEKCDSEQN